MKLNAHYLKGIDDISPEDFPEIRQLLLSRGVTELELRYIPLNLRKHPLYQQFVRYCQYFDNLKKDEIFEQKLKNKNNHEEKRLAGIRKKEEEKLKKDKEVYEKAQLNREKQLAINLDKKLEKKLQHENRIKLQNRLIELNKLDKKLAHEQLMLQHKELKRLKHEQLLAQHQLNKKSKNPN